MILHQCQNCGVFYDEEQLSPIKDLTQRVSPGEQMPSGECPAEDCGALCHEKDLPLAEVVELAVGRLEQDVLCDPQTGDEERTYRYAAQAIEWLKKAVRG